MECYVECDINSLIFKAPGTPVTAQIFRSTQPKSPGEKPIFVTAFFLKDNFHCEKRF